MSTTPVQLDTELLNLIACEDASLDRTISEHVILDLYRQGMISTGKGARLLGMDYLSFVRWAGERGVPHFRYPSEELDEEVRLFEPLRLPE